ncbi:hypothetical protein CBR_g30030 [Chara braunii]|uniref:NECAP PHear domain-containing protein n=1 Tax=Chara braunii TaxID=69332 RepID=A0A388LBV0_CHABU|nr:hypothetical protein CBR_g30030 [Chara braunii]|eukprot:GBG79766.1 hypothetical protein CBR_g30030 [Chara braunii]
MSYDDDDDSFEHTLLVVREVNAFKIPPRSSSGGYKCAEWLVSDKIWTGRLRVVSAKEKCEIRLEDSNTGELFASCPVHAGRRETTVESVVDSSRYFVLRIDDGRGHHAFIGLGFNERNEAFDFNVALSDHEKYAKREKDEVVPKPPEEKGPPPLPSVDLRLKEGETIRINVKTKPLSGTGLVSSSSSNPPPPILATGKMKAPLAPPPGGGRIRAPLPPPPGDMKTVRGRVASLSSRNPDQGRVTGDPFADLSQLEGALPSAGRGKTVAKDGPSSANQGWASF